LTPDVGKEAGTDEAVRDEAIAWLGRLRGPGGAEYHAAFEDWYTASPHNAEIYDDVLGNWERMALAGRTPIGEASRRQAATSGALHWPRIAVAAAAAMVLVVLSGVGLHRFGVIGTSPAAPTEVASRTGDIRTVTLADGSRVTLDTDTLLEIAYTTGERRLTLERGRARFDVVHDPARPFIVMAGSGTVIAHGTLFDVERLGARVLVSLLRGSVEVTGLPADTNGPASKGRFLEPGQRLAIESRAAPGSPTALSATETRWTSGMLSFDDTPLAEVAAATNRYNGVKIGLADPALGELRFSGTFTARDPLGLARMAVAMFDLSLSRDDQGNILLGRPSAASK
jgi:transmembrane sensor